MTSDPLPGPVPIPCSRCLLSAARTEAAPCPFTIRTVEEGDLLQPAGQLPAELLHVRSAVLELSSTTLSGSERRYSQRGPGALVGWEGLRAQPTEFEVRAVREGEVCTLPTEEAQALIAGDGACAFVPALLDELAWLDCDASLGRQPVAVRVARYLLGEGHCLGRESGLLTGRTVARRLGIRHETLSRVLSRLRRAGWIERDPLRVLDRAALQRLVDDGPRPDRW